jgi:hypothetical protein
LGALLERVVGMEAIWKFAVEDAGMEILQVTLSIA